MLNTLKKLSGWLFFSVILSACGGGSGGGNEVPANTASESLNAAAIEDDSEAAEKVVLEMDSLVATEGFNFTRKNIIQVSLELSDYQEQRAYVSVYREYQQLDSGRYYPDSTTRAITGALQKGLFEQSFIGFNNQQKYLIEIWFYDNRAPIQKELLLEDNLLLW